MNTIRAMFEWVRTLTVYAVRSGRGWTVMVMVSLALAVIVAAASQVAVPTAVYTLF